MTRIIGLDLGREIAAAPAGDRTARYARLRAEAVALVHAEGLAAGAYCYEIIPLQAVRDGVLLLDGESLEAPRLVPASGTLTALACAACTLGPRLEERVRALFATRQTALAVALDEIGNELLWALNRRLQDRILAETIRRCLTMAGELRPGDPGLALAAQGLVLRRAGAAAIGLQARAGDLLEPLKSTSMILGVGKDLPAASWSRCDECRSRDRCTLGRRRAAAA